MSELRVYEEAGKPLSAYKSFEDISSHLRGIGVGFERWEATRQLDSHAGQDEVIEAYRGSVNRLMNEYGFKSVDVLSVKPDHPQRDALRQKFLAEHTHADFEVRFFVDGEGLFYLHTEGKVFAVRCTRGDLISVPANIKHWFDTGPSPGFTVIRLFTTPEGWQAEYTGDQIADRFPRLEAPDYLPLAA